MDKRVVLAVAGSGKTASIIDQLVEGRRALILTHTTNAISEIRKRVIRKFGCVPDGVAISTYFAFLISFGYRPLLQQQIRDRGVTFKAPSERSRTYGVSDARRYMDGGRRLYHCRLAKLLQLRCMGELIARIERYYDHVIVDEVQDFSAHDFDLLMAISCARVPWYLVGDFYQHTFDTSRDGNVNASLHDDYVRYRKRLCDEGFSVDTDSLKGSYRCSSEVCTFIRDHLGIDIYPSHDRAGEVRLVECAREAAALRAEPTILKLFYKEHYNFECYSQNWGASKGLDGCKDVCVVLNKSSWKDYRNGTLQRASTQTRNRLYVASSRPHGTLYLVPEELLRGARDAAKPVRSRKDALAPPPIKPRDLG